jgi:GTP pyrophosphokinase
VNDRFAREKEQILSQYILHHEVDEKDVPVLAERLDRVVARAEKLHLGQKRKTGEDYIHHPLRTALEVSRFGRIIDWASIEASFLHDCLEDTDCTYGELASEFPDAAKLVEALTKIKDSRQLTYKKLFSHVLQDIRVLLIKLADRLDNLESLGVFSREKQLRIANESALMYANICRRLCMTDLAERLIEKVGQYTLPEALESYRKAQAQAREELARPLSQLLSRLAEIFPGDLVARIEVRWNRFNPDVPPMPENFFTLRITTDSLEEAYRALGRVHLAFPAIPGTFTDTITNPRQNGYRALETSVSHRNRILRFYITSRAADRYNRLGLLSMDIDSPQFNLQYLDDLREFLQNEEGDIQDFLRFQQPDAIQVTSPKGEVFSLEENATALDFAFAVHDKLGLRATGALVNDERAHLATVLHSGDRVVIETSPEPVCDERYLKWAHSRKALAALRRHLRRVEELRAATTGRQWLLEAAAAAGIASERAEASVNGLAEQRETSTERIYRDLCLGKLEIVDVLKDLGSAPKTGLVDSLVRRLTPSRETETRKVRRYDFNDPHIRFCPRCAPVVGDEIDGTPIEGRLMVHRKGCPDAGTACPRLPLAWDRSKDAELRDPGPMEMEIEVAPGPGAFYAVVEPFRSLALDIQTIRMPDGDDTFRIRFVPGAARTLDRLIRALRKTPGLRSIRLLRDMQASGC